MLSWIVLPRLALAQRDSLIAQWCREVLDLLQIHVVIHGERPATPLSSTLFVANHISWIDVLLLLSLQQMRFIAKKEVQGWPIIGYLASQTGTWFFKRTSPHELADVLQATSLALHQGGCVAFFPEGTTTDGTSVRPFHSGLFEAAVQSKARIQPLCIWYERSDGMLDQDLAFVGHESLVFSILKLLTRPITVAHLSFLPPLDSSTGDRRHLANLCQIAIAQHLTQQSKCRLSSPHTTQRDISHRQTPPVAAA
ncbi:MAG: 1-acyl-sn-glycerol-3-phosphate acyltransferase [Nitrospira sp.]|nr:1-acyl-sn-glycerol-3-phosphate acyltransferase [Nitrospira sp.]